MYLFSGFVIIIYLHYIIYYIAYYLKHLLQSFYISWRSFFKSYVLVWFTPQYWCHRKRSNISEALCGCTAWAFLHASQGIHNWYSCCSSTQVRVTVVFQMSCYRTILGWYIHFCWNINRMKTLWFRFNLRDNTVLLRMILLCHIFKSHGYDYCLSSWYELNVIWLETFNYSSLFQNNCNHFPSD